MIDREAVELIREAVGTSPGTWADLGCGSGTFTRALATLLGPASRIHAVDRDESALRSLRRWAEHDAPNVSVIAADFTDEHALAQLGAEPLDGILLANALHFVADQEVVLRRLVARLRPGGRVVFVEYDRRDASPYVPYPISVERLRTLARSAGLSAPEITATRPSRYQGTIYVAAGQVGGGSTPAR